MRNATRLAAARQSPLCGSALRQIDPPAPCAALAEAPAEAGTFSAASRVLRRGLAALAGAVLAAASTAAAQPAPRGVVLVAAGHGTDVAELRRWDAEVDRMTRSGGLRVVSRRPDRTLAGRVHEYLAQQTGGVPVHGAGISRQLDRGATVSLLGAIHAGIDVDTTPALGAGAVAARLARQTGAATASGRPPRLVVLPRPDGSYVLAYRALMSDARIYFADAADGQIVHAVDAFWSQQAAVGSGAAPDAGGQRKVSATRSGGRFVAHDRLRPAEIVTLDSRFNPLRFSRLLVSHLLTGLPPGEPVWTPDDVAADSDNDWDDPAVVGAHVHGGWTYDYFRARHGWNGVDDADGRMLSLVNLGIANALAAGPPYGPEGTGLVAFGAAVTETSEEPLTSLDVVAHELTHLVTYHAVNRRTGNPLGLDPGPAIRLGPESFSDGLRTLTCDTTQFPIVDFRGQEQMVPALCMFGRFVLGSDQGTAVNEAYSDIFAVAAGFFHEEAGAPADYRLDSIRSLDNPALQGDPDAYPDRIEFALAATGQYSGFLFRGGRFVVDTQYCCYGAEHWNSLILSHAFYLAVEGGANRTTGIVVEGVGAAERALVERIFFRALTELLPATTSLPGAADAIRQAAADLAAGGAAQRAVEQALRAVGLPPGTTAL